MMLKGFERGQRRGVDGRIGMGRLLLCEKPAGKGTGALIFFLQQWQETPCPAKVWGGQPESLALRVSPRKKPADRVARRRVSKRLDLSG